MPLYAMQTSKLPASTCSSMEKTIRGFVWGKKLEKQCLSKVAWSRIKCSKDDGGLGLRDLRLVNSAFGMKACWGILTKPSSLWGRLLCAKYKFNPSVGFDPCAPASCTLFWRLICNSWASMNKKLVWALGTGIKVQFWNHQWIPTLKGPLSEVVTRPLPDHMFYKTVDYFASGSSWEWTKFQQFLPEEVINSIAAIMPPYKEQGEDEIYWGLSSSGTFSIKSAYNDMGISQTQQIASLWRNVWSCYGPQRIKVFFWLLLNNGVMVNEELAKWRISSTELCNMCGGGSESSLHMLRDCLDAK